MDWLENFVEESNHIEGINGFRKDEVEAHRLFLALRVVVVNDLERLVSVLQRNARLRDQPGLNVMVGGHIPPEGGPHIRRDLAVLLINMKGRHPFEVHKEYENLHPFTDGNGRSGRAIWLWMMMRGSDRDVAQARSLGFLHAFYYQTLDETKPT